MASCDIVVASLMNFHDVEGCVAGFLSSQAHDVSCTFNAQTKQFTISCPPRKLHQTADAFLQYMSVYQDRELKPVGFFEDPTEAHKLSVDTQNWANDDFYSMWEDVEAEFAENETWDSPDQQVLIDWQPIKLKRALNPQVTKLYTGMRLRDLAFATSTTLELNKNVLLAEAGSQVVLDDLVKRLSVFEESFSNKQGKKLSYEIHTGCTEKSALFRFQYLSTVLDASLASLPRFFKNYLDVQVVLWDDKSRQGVSIKATRSPIYVDNVGPTFVQEFSFKYGKNPQESRQYLVSEPNYGQQNPAKYYEDHQVNVWRENVPDYVKPPFPSQDAQDQANVDLVHLKQGTEHHLLLSEEGESSMSPGQGHSSRAPRNLTKDDLPSTVRSFDLAGAAEILPDHSTSAASSGNRELSASAPMSSQQSLGRVRTDQTNQLLGGHAGQSTGPHFNLHGEVTTSLLCVLEKSRMIYNSAVVLEAKVAKLFVIGSTVPEKWKPGETRPAKEFKPGDWRTLFRTIRGEPGPVQSHSSLRLTDSEQDAAFLASLLQNICTAAVNETTEYVVTCHDTQGDEKLSLHVRDNESLGLQIRSEVLGGVKIHCPSNTWDASISVTAARLPDVVDLAPFRSIIDHTWARGFQSSDAIEQAVVGSEIDSTVNVQDIVLRRCKSFTVGGENERPLVVHLTQVKSLKVSTNRGEFVGWLEDENLMRRDGRLWYELSVQSSHIDEALKRHRGLKFGDVVDYDDMEIFKEELGRVTSLLMNLLPRLDNVGLNSTFRRTKRTPPASVRDKQATESSKGSGSKNEPTSNEKKAAAAYERFVAKAPKPEYPDLI